MLKKLIKYDLESVLKFLVIFYSLALFFSILTRIFFSIDNSLIMNIIGQVCSGTTISMIFSILINNLIRLWIRFKNNFYGDESYLTHTLPIKKSTLYLSKTISSIIILFTSTLIIALVLFIAYYSKENIEVLKSVLLPLANVYGSTMIGLILQFLFIFFLELANALQAGYMGIILGHKMNNKKVGYSVLFGFLAYMATQVFVLLLTFIEAIFNEDLMNLFYTMEMINIDTIKLVIYLAFVIYSLTLVIGYMINLKLFKKGVNVD